MLRERARISEQGEQFWVSTLVAVYGGMLCIGSPISGFVVDRCQSRRVPILTGLSLLTGATILLRLGTSIEVLVLARALQGLSAAIVWTANIALLVDTAGRDNIGQLMGTASLAASGGGLLGPLVGGVVYDHAGYSALFTLIFALIMADLAMPLLIIEPKNPRLWATSAGHFEYGTLNDDASTIRSPASEEGTEAYVNLGKAAAIRSLLKSTRLLVALLGCFIQAALVTSFDGVLPIFVETLFGWSPTGSGLIFLTLIIPSLLSPLAGHIVDIRPKASRHLVAAGFLLCVPSFAALGFVVYDTMRQQVLLGVSLVLIGIFTSLSLPPLMAEAMHAVIAIEECDPGVFGEKGATAQAYGILNFAYAAGTLIGPSVAGYLKVTHGWCQMSWSLGIASGLTAIPTFLYIGGWIGGGNRGSTTRRPVQV